MNFVEGSEEDDHYISEELGFLTYPEPLKSLPQDDVFMEYENIVSLVPNLILSGKLRSLVDKLPKFPTEKLKNRLEIQRAMLLLSIIGNTYLHGNSFIDEEPLGKLPPNISIPWCECAKLLGRKPVLSHATCVLDNWTKIDKNAEFSLQNIRLLNNIIGGMDEAWFFLVTADIEKKAAPGIISVLKLMKSIEFNHIDNSIKEMMNIKASIQEMTKSLKLMRQMCSPTIFYNRVRLYLSGWEKGSEKFPNGVVYEGVSSESQYYLGGSAAQSTPMHIFDELFNIKHKIKLLTEMRDYMPKEHRQFINDVNKWSDGNRLSNFVVESQNMKLKELYNETLNEIIGFRSYHIQIVTSYIVSQTKNLEKEKGTGSSSLIPFLKTLREEASIRSIKK
eukprot:gene7937-12406_t